MQEKAAVIPGNDWFIEATINATGSEEQLQEIGQLLYQVKTTPEHSTTELGAFIRAENARQAFNDGIDRLTVLTLAAGFVGKIIQAEVITQEARLKRMTNCRRIPDIVGVAEIQQILKVNTRQQIGQMAARDGFPDPVAILSAGRIWLREDIETFKRNWRRTHRVKY